MTYQLMMLITVVVCFGLAYWEEKVQGDFTFRSMMLTLSGTIVAILLWCEALQKLPDYYEPNMTIEKRLEKAYNDKT